MKVKIVENPALHEDLVTIECKSTTPEILSLSNYIENYGRVCEEAFESGDFSTCAECGDDFCTGERGINTEEGIWFCCHD